MKLHKSKQLCEQLLSAVSTEDVQKIIEENSFTDEDWKPYGNRENNWDTVSNQQANAVGALTELITNAIDAVLVRKAYEFGIKDLTSEAAPQSMQEAVSKFYPVIEGKLSSLESAERTKLAKESVLIGVRRKRKGGKYPTITVVDFGEGQNPDDFPHTFLSLSEANKEGIDFVQGKFNMGSTGSIRFCTESDITRSHYKLIVSKKYDGELWGWTLIRVSQVQAGKKLPVVEYLAPGGAVPRFSAVNIKAFADDTEGVIEQGTAVRLYDYDVGSGAHSVSFGLYYALTFNLLECALPIRIYDFDGRPAKDKGPLRERGIDDRTFSGMDVILKADFTNSSQPNPPIPEQKPEERTTEFTHLVTELSHEGLGQVRIWATGVSELPEFMKNSKKRIFYTINGQTHATENASFLNSPKVGFGDLQHHLIVNVQCEHMDKTALTMFMGNRENRVDNRLSRELDGQVQKSLSADPKLKQYQKIIRQRRVDQRIEDDHDTKEILNDLIDRDPSMRALLGLGTVGEYAGGGSGGRSEWKGNKFPTFLNPQNTTKKGERYVKELPLNAKRIVKCKTDAANDYLSRDSSPGRVYCDPKSSKVSRWASLHNGVATFTFESPSGVDIDDKILLDIGFDDIGPRPTPLTFALTLKIVADETPGNNKSGRKTKTSNKRTPKIADPTEWVTKEHWSDFGFTKKSGAAVRVGGNEIRIYVNRDHERLVEMRSKERDQAIFRLNEFRFRVGVGFLTLSVYRHYQKNDEPNSTADASELAGAASNAIASYIIPILNTLRGAEQE